MPRSPRPTAALALLALVSLLVVAGPEPADAQSRLVLVSVHTEPALPQPGQDVTAKIRINGCPPGDALVEIYLTTDDGVSSDAALMARKPAITSLVFRAHADVVLTNAVEGWYGVRVVCGSFRPERKPMANTSFAVGARPTKESTVAGSSVAVGGSLRVEGTGCAGTTVEYQVAQATLTPRPFEATGTFPVAADGSWGGDATFPPSITPGSATIRRRCVLQNQLGETVTINYRGGEQIMVLAAPTTVAPPPGG